MSFRSALAGPHRGSTVASSKAKQSLQRCPGCCKASLGPVEVVRHCAFPTLFTCCAYKGRGAPTVTYLLSRQRMGEGVISREMEATLPFLFCVPWSGTGRPKSSPNSRSLIFSVQEGCNLPTCRLYPHASL